MRTVQISLDAARDLDRRFYNLLSPLAFARGFFFLFVVLIGSEFGASFALAFDAERLSQTEEWRALLFYSPRVLRSESSIVDSPAFFLSKSGATNPLAELRATLEAFRAEEDLATKDDLKRCGFPARYEFLKRSGVSLRHRAYDCPWVKEYFDAVTPKSVSLVFSAFYLNNPASMMGHTFIRFHRSSDSSSAQSPLLDHVVNMAANPTTTNQFLYAISGISGLFPGTFSMSPYYLKIAEYVNYESRDLWEYELNFTQDEVDRILLSTLEVGRHAINYFYADENCSYLMLFFFDIARPSLDLRAKFMSIVTPSDTVRETYDTGIVRRINFIPSQRTSFRARYEILSDAQRRAFHRVIQLEKSDEELISGRFTDVEKAQIIDAAIDYIGYVEKLVGERRPEKFGPLYTKLLSARSRLPSGPIGEIPRPDDTAPHLAHLSKRVSLGAIQRKIAEGDRQDLVAFGLRPSFHDHLTPGGGFPLGLGIELGNTMFSYNRENSRVALEEFRLFDITSLQEQAFDNKIPSWRLGGGFARDQVIRDGMMQARGRYYLSGGMGASASLFKSNLASLFVRPEVGLLRNSDERFFAAAFVGPELLQKIGRTFAAQGAYQLGADNLHHKEILRRYGFSAKIYAHAVGEMELSYRRQDDVDQVAALLHYFF